MRAHNKSQKSEVSSDRGGGGRGGVFVNVHHVIGSDLSSRLSHYIIGLVSNCTNDLWLTGEWGMDNYYEASKA